MARFPSSRTVGDRSDLSVPKGAPVRGSLYDADAFGRFSEALARFLGTGKYLVGQTVLVLLWIALNSLVFIKHWDPYPYILLNLFLSMMAGVQAAALLIAAKRADAISSEVALHTSSNTDDIKTLIQENTDLTSAVKKNTDLLEEIHLHVSNIGKALGAELGNFAPSATPTPTPDT